MTQPSKYRSNSVVWIYKLFEDEEWNSISILLILGSKVNGNCQTKTWYFVQVIKYSLIMISKDIQVETIVNAPTISGYTFDVNNNRFIVKDIVI